MKLNHIDLQVDDVQETVLFFERYFDFELRTSRTSPAIAILDDNDGFVLVVQRKKHEEERFPRDFHVGFLVETEEEVVSFHETATRDGLDISAIQRNSRGTMTYIRAPGGFLVEVSCRAARAD